MGSGVGFSLLDGWMWMELAFYVTDINSVWKMAYDVQQGKVQVESNQLFHSYFSDKKMTKNKGLKDANTGGWVKK